MKFEFDKDWCMKMASHERLQEAIDAADQGRAEGLLGMYPMAAQILAGEVRRLQQQVREWEKLQDPVHLHVNLLRGIPCKLDRETFLHLAGSEAPNVRAKQEPTHAER